MGTVTPLPSRDRPDGAGELGSAAAEAGGSGSGSGTSDPDDAASVSSGAHALALIQRQTRRLGTLHRSVLADADPEPLHQLRVSLRRLRTALAQFAPALVLPATISDPRIAKVARRTGLTRDLDVMGERLKTSLVPSLPRGERSALRPALRRLARERRQAFGGLEQALTGAGYLNLLARLHKWQRKPVFTAVGTALLEDRLLEWKVPIVSGLFLHPGWWADDPASPDLHDLRKRIKGVRYALENLEAFLDPDVLNWITELKQAQDDLGDLHDLDVLRSRFIDRGRSGLAGSFPVLETEIQRQRSDRWRQWRERAAEMGSAAGRLRVHRHLLGPA
jgi:CHAD domain-containing protein